MTRHMRVWMTRLAVVAVAACGTGSALAQQGAPQQTAPQQGAPRQAAPQQTAPQQGTVRQDTTVTTGTQTQVRGTAIESGVGLSHIGIRPGRRFDCNHVIEMLLRKYDHDRFGGGIVQPAPIVHRGPYGDHVVQHELSDLELVSVGLLDAGGSDYAPTYGITIANHGKVDICHFKVSAVAVLGKIHEFCPTTTIKIDKICPGESMTAEVQLPFAALAMDNCEHRNPFDTLVVAIDALDQVVECNEVNNIVILQRTGITVIEETTESTTVEQTTVENSTTTEVPPSATDNVQAAPAPSAPGPDGNAPAQKPSPLDNIDLDNLDLSDESEATGLLSLENSPF